MLTQILSFLGLIIGYILASKTKEELDEGKKWFKIISLATLMLLIIILLKDNYYFNLEFFIAISIGLILNYFIKRIYLFLGIIIAPLNKNELISLIIFIFGLSYGTLEYIKFKKINYKSILINFILFIVPSILLFNRFFILSTVLSVGIFSDVFFFIFPRFCLICVSIGLLI